MELNQLNGLHRIWRLERVGAHQRLEKHWSSGFDDPVLPRM
jgi:hypothetical protein